MAEQMSEGIDEDESYDDFDRIADLELSARDGDRTQLVRGLRVRL